MLHQGMCEITLGHAKQFYLLNCAPVQHLLATLEHNFNSACLRLPNRWNIEMLKMTAATKQLKTYAKHRMIR